MRYFRTKLPDDIEVIDHVIAKIETRVPQTYVLEEMQIVSIKELEKLFKHRIKDKETLLLVITALRENCIILKR